MKALQEITKTNMHKIRHKKIFILVIITFIAFAVINIHRSNRNSEYWQEQFDKCGKVGYYENSTGNCEPVEYIRKLENDYTAR